MGCVQSSSTATGTAPPKAPVAALPNAPVAPTAKPGFAPCATKGCKCKASYNGVKGQACCTTCRDGTPCTSNVHPRPTHPDPAIDASFARCAREDCPCLTSFNGVAGEYCCRPCRNGKPCVSAFHQQQPKTKMAHAGSTHTLASTASTPSHAGGGASSSTLAASPPSPPSLPPSPPGGYAPCKRSDCPCAASWNGRSDEYCSPACRDGQPCASNIHTAPMHFGGPVCWRVPCTNHTTISKPHIGFCSWACQKNYVGPPGVMLKSDHPKYQAVEKQLNDDWDAAKQTRQTIGKIWRIVDVGKETAFEKYRKHTLGDIDSSLLYGKGENPGNVMRVFHGTKKECDFAGWPCGASSCNLCGIVQNGFDLSKLGSTTGNKGLFGPGFYTTLKPATAFGYPPGVTDVKKKVLLVLKVALGKPEIQNGDAQTSAGCAPGFHSRVVNKTTGVDEEVIFDNQQLLLTYVVTF